MRQIVIRSVALLLTLACAACLSGTHDQGDEPDGRQARRTVEPTSTTSQSADSNAPAEDMSDGSNAPAEDMSDGGDALIETEPAQSATDEILTHRYDNARTGANLAERTLTPARVQQSFTRLGSWPVDGQIYAQVLVANDVEVDGSVRSVAIVATMNNSLYAFDADADPENAPLWHRGSMGEFGQPGLCSRNVVGPNGILSTPVIAPDKHRLFVVARDCDPNFPPETPRCEHKLFQIDLASGDIQRSITIAGDVSVADGNSRKPLSFDASAQWNRPALLLTGNQLVIAFGSGPAGNQHEEDFVYHGWVFRYQIDDLDQPPEVYCTTPRGRGGSVWQAGAGPAADEQGIYFTGANGIQADSMTHPPEEWPTAPIGQEDSVVRLPRSGHFPTPNETVLQYADTRDYIAAGNVFQHMESGDNGFGSSGPTLIPASHSLLVGTKSGLVYLLDRETLQPRQAPLSSFTEQPLQPGHTLYLHSWWGVPVITQSLVFWRPQDDSARYGYAFAWASRDLLRSFRYDYVTDRLELSASADVPAIRGGGNLTLSALGGDRQTGIVWASTRTTASDDPSGQLWAFDPISLEVLLRVDTPAWSKFTPPTVAHGRVFLPSTAPDNPDEQAVLIYGLAR